MWANKQEDIILIKQSFIFEWKLKPSEQHITRALYFPQGSVNTFIQYTWHVHGISFKLKKKKKQKKKKKAHLQKEKEETKETIERWLIVQLPSIGMVWF